MARAKQAPLKNKQGFDHLEIALLRHSKLPR